MFWLFIVPIAALLLGLAKMPIGYYTFLRIIVCLASVVIAAGVYDQKKEISGGVVLFAIIAILFNPFFPIYLNKEVWSVIDLITAAIFGVFYFTYRQESNNC